MKKFLRPKNMPTLALFCGLAGFALRLWTLGGGPDSLGLYAPQPMAWALLLTLTAALGALLVVMARPLSKPGEYHDHFFASLPAAVGNAAAAAAMILSGFRASGNPSTIYSLIMSLLALASALGFCLAAVARYHGNRQPFWAYLTACLFLALRLFDRCRGWSETAQTGVYLFPFLASACLLLALFQLTALQVDLGSRRLSTFFSLSGIYLCMVCFASSEELFFYLLMTVFLLTNLCSLRPLKKQQAAPAEPEQSKPAPSHDPTEMSYEELMDWLKNG